MTIQSERNMTTDKEIKKRDMGVGVGAHKTWLQDKDQKTLVGGGGVGEQKHNRRTMGKKEKKEEGGGTLDTELPTNGRDFIEQPGWFGSQAMIVCLPRSVWS